MSFLKLGLQSFGKLFQAAKTPIQAGLQGSRGGQALVVAGRSGRLARISDTLKVTRANVGQTWNSLSAAERLALKKTGAVAAAVPVGYGLLNSGNTQQVPPGYGGYYQGQYT